MTESGINLEAIIRKLWQGRYIILLFTFLFMGVGFFKIHLIPKEYRAQCVFGVLGKDKSQDIFLWDKVNFESTINKNSIPLQMYPKLLFSTPFLKEVIYSPMDFKGNHDSLSFIQYRSGNTDVRKENTSENVPEVLTLEESACIAELKSKIKSEISDGDCITISIVMPEALVATQLIQKIQVLFPEYIKKLQMDVEREHYDIINDRYMNLKAELAKKQEKLINFNKENNNMSVLVQKKILNDESEVYAALCGDMLRTLEFSKGAMNGGITLKVIDPVSIPLSPLHIDKKSVMIRYVFTGVFSGVILVLLLYCFNIDIRGRRKKL